VQLTHASCGALTEARALLLQIEFRLMAHFSGDASLVQAFSCGDDPFKALAGIWLKKPADQVRLALPLQVVQGDSSCGLWWTTLWSSQILVRPQQLQWGSAGGPGLAKGIFNPEPHLKHLIGASPAMLVSAV